MEATSLKRSRPPSRGCPMQSILGALLALVFLQLFLVTSRIHAAPLYHEGTGTDPRVQAITVTSNLPVFDTHLGDDIAKVVYFNNGDTSGVLTLTFEISGTPTLTLTAGAAFGGPARTYTSTATPWLPVVTYGVDTGDGDYPDVVYTAINTNGLQAAIVITYVCDIVGPTILSPSIVESSAYVHAVETALYYTNTMSLEQTFAVRGYATDAASGIARVRFSPAFGDSPSDLVSGFYPWQSSPAYTIEPAATAAGTITATVYDRVGNAAVQPYTYALDGTPPTVTLDAPSVWPGLAPIPVVWQAQDAQSGVARTHLYYRRVPTDTEWQDSGLEQLGPSGIFHFTPQGYLTYAFVARTTDNLGNVSTLPATGPQTVVKLARVYLPLTMKAWVWWYQYDIYEPNDTPALAHGPLVSGQVYQAYMWDTTDQDDYYHFTPSAAGNAQITLTHIPTNCDYDLYIYYFDGQSYQLVTYSHRSGSVDESTAFPSVAGRKYYIRVFRYKGFSSQQPYYLTVTYP